MMQLVIRIGKLGIALAISQFEDLWRKQSWTIKKSIKMLI